MCSDAQAIYHPGARSCFKRNRSFVASEMLILTCASFFLPDNIQVASGELGEQKPQAVTSEGMEGIVVSRETVAGATWINDERKTLGYKPLSVVAVNLVSRWSPASLLFALL